MSLKSVRCLALLILTTLPLIPRASFAAGGKEPTVPELVSIVKNNPDPEVKRNAIIRLGGITVETDVRNNNVIQVLTNVVMKTLDPFVGAEAVDALAKLQLNADKSAKIVYIPPFILILKDKQGLPSIRSAIAANFFDTLDKEGLPDKQAYLAMLEIREEPAGTEPCIARHVH